MTIELVPLCNVTAQLRPPVVLAQTPAGDRMIFEVESGRVEGERLSGSVKGSANADWLTIGPGGVGTLDVRVLMETDDGALVLFQYLGRVDTTKGHGAPVYIAPRFETGDDRYRWLNQVQAVGKAHVDGLNLHYEMYELR